MTGLRTSWRRGHDQQPAPPHQRTGCILSALTTLVYVRRACANKKSRAKWKPIEPSLPKERNDNKTTSAPVSSSSLEGNKIAAAVLVAGIVAMLAGFISEIVFGQHAVEEQAYPIAVVEASAPVAAAAVLLSKDEILSLIASADLEKGERVAKKCVSCHTFSEGGKDGIGPNLWNIVNRPIAATQGFAYSKAFVEHAEQTGGVWDYESLFHFLQSPRKYIKGTKMSFVGLSKEQDRADVIEYMRSFSSAPPPVE